MNELTNQSSDSEIFCPEERIKELELRTQRRNNFEEELFKDRFPTEKELAYHKELLGEPQPPFSTLEPKIKRGDPWSLKIPYIIGTVYTGHAYIDLKSPVNIMSRAYHNKIREKSFQARRTPYQLLGIIFELIRQNTNETRWKQEGLKGKGPKSTIRDSSSWSKQPELKRSNDLIGFHNWYQSHVALNLGSTRWFVTEVINPNDYGLLDVKVEENVDKGEPKTADDAQKQDEDGLDNENDEQERFTNDSSSKDVNAIGQQVNTAILDVNTGSLELNVVGPSVSTASSNEKDSTEEEPEIEPTSIAKALSDSSWVEAMHKELLQFKLQQVWILVDLLNGKKAIGKKWVFRNKKDKRGIMIRNKASDYAGATLDRKSTTGGCQFLGNRLISWQCKKQTVVATSTTEAEYVAAASCCGQVHLLTKGFDEDGNKKDLKEKDLNRQ
ncbi:hypothetical protein Tco_0162680 [Tanacetum coccineum]